MQKNFNIGILTEGTHYADLHFISDCAVKPGQSAWYQCAIVSELLGTFPNLVKTGERQYKDEDIIMGEDDRLAWIVNEDGGPVKNTEVNFTFNAGEEDCKLAVKMDSVLAVCDYCMNRCKE
jgi:hypothetical protein